MKGSIRFFLGLIIVFGAVGGMDANPEASLLALLGLSVAGLGLMYSGARALSQYSNGVE